MQTRLERVVADLRRVGPLLVDEVEHVFVEADSSDAVEEFGHVRVCAALSCGLAARARTGEGGELPVLAKEPLGHGLPVLRQHLAQRALLRNVTRHTRARRHARRGPS